ncbi:CVNH domain-containing protein [Colletotrichum navitas]|uniref:CVNH domain-containing protein n=1 Tax=Colletotrichum navitas TaxID=681940 RepID=A0AAD8V729_9PEZI|nr:CVNH domain-containing protein [Colletotrichum navitas]KAK1594201.1 CVNH domain-containing protein [Colletotrichum navitas]
MRSLSITAVLSAVAATVSARDCPLESDCVQKSCKNFQLPKIDGVAFNVNGRTWKLTADCKDNAGRKTVTHLYLEECLANMDGNLIWTPGGGFICSDCKLTKTDPLTMECWCLNKKGKGKTRVVNLSEGIWVYDGAIGCYQTSTGTALKTYAWDNYNAGLLKSPGIGDY